MKLEAEEAEEAGEVSSEVFTKADAKMGFEVLRRSGDGRFLLYCLPQAVIVLQVAQ